jgi:stage IV sporulation protein FB
MGRFGAITVRVLGIPVSIGPAIVVGLGVLGVLSRFSGVQLVEWIGLGILALLLHELGHALAFRRFGVPASITFWVLGGLTVPDDLDAAMRLSDRQMLVVVLAGPVVGLVIGAAALAAMVVFRELPRSIREPLFLWMFVNLGWGIFNLLPISSLDGGRALEYLAAALFGRAGRLVGLAAGLVASVLIAVAAAVFGLYSVAFIAVVFGLLNPSPYRELLEAIRPGRRADRPPAPSGRHEPPKSRPSDPAG